MATVAAAGLEEKPTTAWVLAGTRPFPLPVPEEPVPDPVPSPVPDPVPSPVPEPVPSPVPEPVPSPVPEPVPSPVPEPVPSPVPPWFDPEELISKAAGLNL